MVYTGFSTTTLSDPRGDTGMYPSQIRGDYVQCDFSLLTAHAEVIKKQSKTPSLTIKQT